MKATKGQLGLSEEKQTTALQHHIAMEAYTRDDAHPSIFTMFNNAVRVYPGHVGLF